MQATMISLLWNPIVASNPSCSAPSLTGMSQSPIRAPNQLIPIAARVGIIPENVVGVFHELRIARNRAVHSCDDFTDKDASWFLDTTRKMISSVRGGAR